jgi:upstream activation factor subunit UAF30
VKKMWEYIKANGLQNPLHKTEIICDERLRPIFNVDKIHMFTMNKVSTLPPQGCTYC